MMFQKPIVILSCMLLLMAITSTAQTPPSESGTPVLDTTGRPLERGVEYFIRPAITDVAGDVTLQRRNGTRCPLYVGQERVASGRRGFPVTFTPFIKGEKKIREGRDQKVVFQAFTTCIQSTQWKIGDLVSGRRLIVAGNENGPTGFFRIDRSSPGIYHLGWCPSDVPIRGRPRCGTVSVLVDNGVRLLALDGPRPAFPFEFERALKVETSDFNFLIREAV